MKTFFALLLLAVGPSISFAANPQVWPWPFKQTEKAVGVEYQERCVVITDAEVREWKAVVPVEHPIKDVRRVNTDPTNPDAETLIDYTQYNETKIVKGKLEAVGEHSILLTIEGKEKSFWQQKDTLNEADRKYVQQLEIDLATKMGEYKPPKAVTEARPMPKVSTPKGPPKTYRQWTNTTGQFTTKAMFGGMADGNVTLIKEDGSRVRLPLEQLSEEDRQWIKNRSR